MRRIHALCERSARPVLYDPMTVDALCHRPQIHFGRDYAGWMLPAISNFEPIERLPVSSTDLLISLGVRSATNYRHSILEGRIILRVLKEHSSGLA